MSHHIRLSSLLALLAGLSTGCEPEPGDAVDASEVLRSTSSPVPDPVHERTRVAVASMLRAHHLDDLPTRASIEAHPAGADALRWLAEHHALQIVRARALSLLALFPDEESSIVLRRVLEDPRAAPGLRAASTRALAGWDLSERADLRALAVESLFSDSVAVAVAGAEALQGVAEVHDELAARRRTATGALERALDGEDSGWGT